jgi:hypothetical protein
MRARRPVSASIKAASADPDADGAGPGMQVVELVVLSFEVHGHQRTGRRGSLLEVTPRLRRVHAAYGNLDGALGSLGVGVLVLDIRGGVPASGT